MLDFVNFFKKYPNFEIVENPSIEIINSYELPEQLQLFWTTYGFGVFMDGYLKMINPEDYMDSIEVSCEIEIEPFIPFAVTALADVLVWEGNCVKLINYRRGYSDIVGFDIDIFFNKFLTDEDFLISELDALPYLETINRLGIPKYDECYGYVPMLVLGGKDSNDKLHVLKLREHLDMIIGFSDMIE